MNRNELKKQIDPSSCITGFYDLEATIGQGHFAIVKSARHIFSGERVAIKIIDKLKLDAVSRDHLFQEVKCMKLVQHPNVVRLYEVIDTTNKLYLIQEFGDGGDMYDYIMKHSDGLDEDHARVYFRQIVDAIKYCHDLKVVHRDLKPENVVFFQQTGQVKLTDFGFSNIFEPGSKLMTSCGSLAYSAPEILLGDSYHAPPVDIWSLGVVLYMLVTGRAPFQEANDSETLTMILDCKYFLPDYLSPECTDLISRMIVRDPLKRITLDEMRKHDWFTKNQINDENYESDVNYAKKLSDQEKDKIIKLIIDGEICESKEIIDENLRLDLYNYITATYYLLAEKLYKSNINKKKITNAQNTTNSKRKILADLQPVAPVQSSSIISKNQFKLAQRNLLMRQNEAREEDEYLVEEEEEPNEDDKLDENDQEIEILNLGDQKQVEDEFNSNIRTPVVISSRRSSRGAMSNNDNLISKLTIPEEDSERELTPEILKHIQDEDHKLKTPVEFEPDQVKLKPPKMSTDTSDSETEQKNYEWTRSTSSSSRSRARLRSNTQFNRPLSVSSDTEHLNGPTPFNQKTLSVEHRLANMSQMSINSQLSKNNSFRYHRSTVTGSETPVQLYQQQLVSSTTPTPRESIVFNRGDEKPITKILQQMRNNSRSVDQKIGENESEHSDDKTDGSSQVRNNNDSYSRAIKQSTLPNSYEQDDHKLDVPENKLLDSNSSKKIESLDRDVNLVGKKKKKSFCSKCCTIV